MFLIMSGDIGRSVGMTSPNPSSSTSPEDGSLCKKECRRVRNTIMIHLYSGYCMGYRDIIIGPWNDDEMAGRQLRPM